MGCKNNPLSKQLVIEHQQRSVEEFKFVVPKDVKDPGPGGRRVANKSAVVFQDANDFISKRRVFALVAAKVKKVHLGITVQFRAINIITAYEIEIYSV